MGGIARDGTSGVATTVVRRHERGSSEEKPVEAMVLVIVWSSDEPARVGEVAVLPASGAPLILGRGPGATRERRVAFFRQRPGTLTERPPLEASAISRRQLRFYPDHDGPRVERIGQCDLELNGARCDAATLRPGDVLALSGELVLYCARRPALIPPSRLFTSKQWGAFGEPDSLGIIGESPALWRLREMLQFAAMAEGHTLLLGQSGTGKELAARAIHQLSSRTGKFVSRNAATLPPGLIDAELFGNAKNYPNPGMAERPGLVGEASGGTLFLDEIGELSLELQAHLLRVLDAGEYQRLGDVLARRSTFCLVAATNRDPKLLKHDVLARFVGRVELPRLVDRREDAPLLARHLLLRAAERSPDLAGHFIGRTDSGYAYPRLDARLVVHLLQRSYTANVRELDALLWRSMAVSAGDHLELPPDCLEVRESRPPDAPPSAPPDATLPTPARAEATPEAIRSALARHEGRVADAARELGLSSRYALYRLVKKHGIDIDERP